MQQRAIRAGSCRERRYADHIFIQIYFRMHHFVVKFSKIFFASGGNGGIDPPSRNPADAHVSDDQWASQILIITRVKIQCTSSLMKQTDTEMIVSAEELTSNNQATSAD